MLCAVETSHNAVVSHLCQKGTHSANAPQQTDPGTRHHSYLHCVPCLANVLLSSWAHAVDVVVVVDAAAAAAAAVVMVVVVQTS